MSNFLIKNVQVVSSESITTLDVHISNGIIQKLGTELSVEGNITEIDGTGKYLFPGVIDDQVHFREPGLTHKGEIYTGARAAVAGGTTSFMEMPNTVPQATTQELLEQKYQRAAQVSLANYSFFMGATNNNLEEVLKTPADKVCGVKVFMGSSTGNMLVDDEGTLENLFRNCPQLIATHCEDEATVRANTEAMVAKYGDNIPIELHPDIRNTEACYLSSSKAVALAKKTGARLHILHISTEKELSLFEPGELKGKKITAEACIHHLWFSREDYKTKGKFIKWNPAVKDKSDRAAIRQAVLDGRIDVLATDHAPHTLEEKDNPYTKCPSGAPLVQHSLVAALQLAEQGVWDFKMVAKKMAEAPSQLFNIKNRGYIKEGYAADLALVTKKGWQVSKENILYKCGWSPLEGENFDYQVEKTFVNGHLVYNEGQFDESLKGQRLAFHV